MPTLIRTPGPRSRIVQGGQIVTPPRVIRPMPAAPAPATPALINDAVIGPATAWSSQRTAAEIGSALGAELPDVTLIFDNNLI